MNTVLQIFLISCLIIFFIIIMRFVVKKRLSLKYSLIWLATILIMIVVTIFPQIVDRVGQFIGVATPVNTVFLLGGMFLVLIVMSLTFIVSHMNTRIYKMAQTMALMEKRIRDFESKEIKSTVVE